VPDEEAEGRGQRIIESALSYVDIHLNEPLPVIVITRVVGVTIVLPSSLCLRGE
jgi:hypothetical protein